MHYRDLATRRRFVAWLAASPFLMAQQAADVIANPEQALSVMDFEPAARRALPPAHFGYLATGVDDDRTLRANREGFQRIQLRPRRVRDVSNIDTRVSLFGTTWDSPIFLAPCGSQKAFHPEGELAAARASKAKRTLKILSTVTTVSVEDMIEATGGSLWYQLYPTSEWEITQKLVRRAEDAGCPVVVLTVDLPLGRNAETGERAKRLDERDCTVCHDYSPGAAFSRRPMFDGIDMTGLSVNRSAMSWDFVGRLKQSTSMKLVLKGIVTHEDARLCVENGVDGIIVSNHGGRAEESGMGTIEALPEVVQAAGDRIPVLIDGGFRRGTDVFKALALGAKAICIGRPYLWGLSAFGQAGVERVLDLLTAEFSLVMGQCGTTSLAGIGPAYIRVR